MHSRRLLRLTALLACFLLFVAACKELDPGFSEDGKQATDMGPGADVANAVAQDSAGRIVVAGRTGPPIGDLAVARYRSDGSLDDTFDGDGRAVTDLGGADAANAVVVDRSGRIVVAGVSNGVGVVVRYLPDGMLDGSFGDGGKAFLDPTFSGGTGVTIDADERILVAGAVPAPSPFPPGLSSPAVQRLLDDGSHDALVRVPHIGSAADIELDAAGRVLLAGDRSENFPVPHVSWAVWRLLPDGGLDGTFAGDGAVTCCSNRPVTNIATALAVADDGSIAVTGRWSWTDSETLEIHNEFAALRLLPDGTPDVSFGSGGFVSTPLGVDGPLVSDGAESLDVGVDSGGRVVLVGSAVQGDHRDVAVTRMLPDGTLDTSFSQDGKALSDFAQRDDLAQSVAIDADDRIVVAGSALTGSETDSQFAVLRYLETTPPIQG